LTKTQISENKYIAVKKIGGIIENTLQTQNFPANIN